MATEDVETKITFHTEDDDDVSLPSFKISIDRTSEVKCDPDPSISFVRRLSDRIIEHPYTVTEYQLLTDLRAYVTKYLQSRPMGTYEKETICWMTAWKAEGNKAGEVGSARRHVRSKDIADWEKRSKQEDEELAKKGVSIYPPSDPELRIAKIPDFELFRFLNARKMKIPEAAELLFNYLNWYDRFDVASLARFQDIGYEMPTIVPLRSLCTWIHHGYDKHDRPVYVEKIGDIDCHRFNQLMSRAEVVLTHVWFLEFCRTRCERASQRAGRRIDSMVQIMDMSGLGIGHRQMIKYFKATSHIDQAYYPEMLANMYFINAPRIFNSLWALCQPFLDPVTKSKIKIMGKDTKQMCDDLGSDNVPVEFGGTCKGCVDHQHCMPPLIPMTDLDGSSLSDEKYEEKEIPAGGKHVVDMTIEESKEYGMMMWQFKVAAKDISFHVEWRSHDGTAHDIHPPSRYSHDPLFTPGSYNLSSPGMIRFIWDNSFSRFTSKKILYRIYRVLSHDVA